MHELTILSAAIVLAVVVTVCVAAGESAESPAEPKTPPRHDAAQGDTAAPPRSPVGFVKGYTWGWTGGRGQYLGNAPAESMKHLAATGAEWATIAFLGHMDTRSTPEIKWGPDNPDMVTDDEIRRAIGLARQHKLKVILKPVVDCRDGTWRAKINFQTPDGKPDADAWARWWQSYGRFLLHYAALAAEMKCELLCVGCEMISTERFEARWRGLARKVREVYAGPLVYNANHGGADKIRWWDAVDIVGVSAYYPVGTDDDASVEAMAASWKPVRDRLAALSRRVNRPVMFIELGVRSARGCSRMPWDWAHRDLPYDGREQARYYEAALRSFWNEPWFCGFSWWDWPARLYKKEAAAGNTSFCCYGKPAEAVLRSWYAKPRK